MDFPTKSAVNRTLANGRGQSNLAEGVSASSIRDIKELDGNFQISHKMPHRDCRFDDRGPKSNVWRKATSPRDGTARSFNPVNQEKERQCVN